MYYNWQSYDVWFLRYRVSRTKRFIVLGHVLPIYSTNNPENPNFLKMKKTLEDIIILQMFTTNDDHKMYGFWDMKYNEQFFSHFGHFLPFYPPNDPKNPNFQKMTKTPGGFIILLMCTINDNHLVYSFLNRCTINHMMHGYWDMDCDGQKFLSIWGIFYSFTPLTSQEIKFFLKMKTTSGDFFNLHMYTKNLMINSITRSLNIVASLTNILLIQGLIQAVFDIGIPILGTLIWACLNLILRKIETNIKCISSFLIKSIT